jgi:AcrR family transcriptional regulator
MPKISAAAAARRRHHILDAARHCFAEHGIHVSVDEICAKAGVSKGAFYLYFSSKDAAIEALAEDHKRVITAFARVDSLDLLVDKLAELTTARSTASNRLELETWTHALKLPALRTALQHNVDSLRNALALNIAAVGHGSAGDGETSESRVAAEILTVFSLGLVASSALGTQRTSRSAETALKTLIRALVKRRVRRRRQSRPRVAPGSHA